MAAKFDSESQARIRDRLIAAHCDLAKEVSKMTSVYAHWTESNWLCDAAVEEK